MTSFATMTPTQRSEHMARIRGRDTISELRVREFLRSAQVRFSTHVKGLPGTPDIVVRSARVVIFVHGCFWHQHGCRRRRPKINREFWDKKFARNVARDRRAARDLRAKGWRVFVVWECQSRARAWRERLLRVLAPSRRLCHDCMSPAKAGYAHCTRCRSRYSRDPGTRPTPRERAKKPSASAERRRHRRLGLCRECAMPADGHACPWHRQQEKSRGLKRRGNPGYVATFHRLAAVGLCRCGSPLKTGHKRCGRCLGKLRREAKARNARYFSAGRCRYCPAPRLDHTFTCKDHNHKLRIASNIYVKRFIDRRRKNGKCVKCGRRSTGYECPRCRRETNRKSREKLQARRDAGKCACGNKAAQPYKMCRRCRERARRRYRDSRVHGA